MGRPRNKNARNEEAVDWSEAIVQALHLSEENHGKLSRDRQLRGQELKPYVSSSTRKRNEKQLTATYILLKTTEGDCCIWTPTI
jgi:hypothetical protein